LATLYFPEIAKQADGFLYAYRRQRVRIGELALEVSVAADFEVASGSLLSLAAIVVAGSPSTPGTGGGRARSNSPAQ
jgi:hypothetical protein